MNNNTRQLEYEGDANPKNIHYIEVDYVKEVVDKDDPTKMDIVSTDMNSIHNLIEWLEDEDNSEIVENICDNVDKFYKRVLNKTNLLTYVKNQLEKINSEITPNDESD